MKYRSRFLLTTVALGFVSALVLMAVAFVLTLHARELVMWVWTPGGWLVSLSNHLCPPRGVECFLGSSRGSLQSLWLLMCGLVAWSFIFFAAWSAGLRLVQRARARAWARQRPLFLHKRRGTS